MEKLYKKSIEQAYKNEQFESNKISVEFNDGNTNHRLDDLLKELGISKDHLDDFREVALVAHQTYVSRSPIDPPNVPGNLVFSHATRALREKFIRKGAQIDDNANHSTIYFPKTGLRIMIALGNDNTGKDGMSPQTKNQKGSKTIQYLDFAEQLYLPIAFENQIHKNNLWVLLIHVQDDRVAYELSKPIKCNKSNKISGWDKRIIFPVEDFTGLKNLKENNDEFAAVEKIVLSKKQN